MSSSSGALRGVRSGQGWKPVHPRLGGCGPHRPPKSFGVLVNPGCAQVPLDSRHHFLTRLRTVPLRFGLLLPPATLRDFLPGKASLDPRDGGWRRGGEDPRRKGLEWRDSGRGSGRPALQTLREPACFYLPPSARPLQGLEFPTPPPQPQCWSSAVAWTTGPPAWGHLHPEEGGPSHLKQCSLHPQELGSCKELGTGPGWGPAPLRGRGQSLGPQGEWENHRRQSLGSTLSLTI